MGGVSNNVPGAVEILHRPESGVREIDGNQRPQDYARHLASYISCPSTVRARTLEIYGTAPPLERIRAMRARHMEARETFARVSAGLGEVERDAHDFRVRSLIRPRSLPKPPAEPVPVRPGTIAALPSAIIAAIAEKFGFTYADMVGRRRTDPIARARQCCAYVLVKRGSTHTRVGEWLGNRDHSTITHACRTFELRATERERRIAAEFYAREGHGG